jgi:hypothetical protein
LIEGNVSKTLRRIALISHRLFCDKDQPFKRELFHSTSLTMGDKASDTYFEGALIPAIDQRGDNPVVIRLSDEERDSGTTRPETIQQCLYHYHRDGFVVLENAIDDTLVDDLYSKIVSDTEIYVGKKFQQWNQGKATKNVSVVPPLTPEWLRREFYANVHMMRVIENVLGPRPELRFINSNVAIPGATGRQAVHSDVNHRYPAIPFGIVVNTYLQDSDEKNGVTEVSNAAEVLRSLRSMLTALLAGMGRYSQRVRKGRPASHQRERLDQEGVYPEASQSEASSTAQNKEREHLLP